MTAIKATNLVKVYNNTHVAVENLSFEIPTGQVFGFLGPNGAGKSTTIKMITGLLKPTSGEIEIMGQPSSNGRAAHDIGYIPQNLVFYDHLTIEENAILFAKSYHLTNARHRIGEVLELLGLFEIKDQHAGDLSGGQKRRLNVALGLLHRPRILVMDEPAAGMDPQSRNILWETIDKLADEEMTIILTTHLMEVVERLADQICIIDHGKILTMGTMDDLKQALDQDEIFEIRLSSQVNQEMQSALVAGLEATFGAVSQKNGQLGISSGRGIAAMQDLMDVLEPVGLEMIEQITARHRSLEDIFIELTGRELRD